MCGFLSFEYAYILANHFIKQNSNIQKLLQQRFKYIFVDEMQDMDEHQYQILEILFFAKGLSKSIYQRIGDKNQSIFNGDIKLDDIWIDRNNVKNITGSYRLSPQIANLANQFSLTKGEIKGLNNHSNIKPHLFVYTHENMLKVTPHYLSLIKKLQGNNQFPHDSPLAMTAVAWVSKKKDDESKITLSSYCPNYSSERVKVKSEYNCLAQYLLCFDKKNRRLNPIAVNIKNGIMKSLRLANIKDEYSMFFKETTFKKLLQEKSISNEKQVQFEINIYIWSISIIRGSHEKVLAEVQVYILSIFNELFPDTPPENNFIYDSYVPNNSTLIASDLEDSELLINTVHGVKGQTHLTTLYMESFYDGEYESTLLKEVFSGVSSSDLIGSVDNEICELKTEIIELKKSGKRGAVTRQKQIKKLGTKIENIKRYSKMLYVGFSRPTHLLAFAVEESRFNKLDIDEDIWDISHIKNVQNK